MPDASPIKLDDYRIEWRETAALLPYANNPRVHSEHQIGLIVNSIREFGWTNPVLVDKDGGIVAGHGRILAAQKLGFDQVPTIALAHLTPAQRRAYVIADNQLALQSSWDTQLLGMELGALREIDFDLGVIGFDMPTIEDLINGPQAPDEFPEFGDDIATEHECPRCHYKWSGKG